MDLNGKNDFFNDGFDIKNSNTEQLKKLSKDIRKKIIDATYKNGGHLSSNLGIVETTVALYHVFDFPLDKLIFDVGHQCYAHKILSGREKAFSSIRQKGGISGFPDITESPFDSFSTGHAGTSIAVALGMCYKRDLSGEDNAVIVVVGDGSLGNGLNLEAITQKKDKPKNLIVILNDNGMSISKNKNGLYQVLSKSTTKESYVKSKNAVKKFLGKSFLAKIFSSVSAFIKRILRRDNFFDELGFKYVGIVDGNNISEIVKILKRVKLVAKNKAVLLHIKTQKGKGLELAEEHADTYHGVGKNLSVTSGSFSLALGEKINELIKKDNKIVAITAGMKNGTGLDVVEKQFPQNFFDVGIAEEFAVTFSAGLAVSGLKPIVAIYSTFLQRAYDEILHDVCAQNLPVIFCLDRAGFVGEDGKTHQGLFDISYLSSIPNLTIFAPNNKRELGECLDLAVSLNSPVAIRYPKNCGEEDNESLKESCYKYLIKNEDYDVTVLAVGPKMREIALNLANVSKYKVNVVSVIKLKPIDKTLVEGLRENSLVVTLEENVIIGGFGYNITNLLKSRNIKVVNFGASDKFYSCASIDEQIKEAHITIEDIEQKITENLTK